MHDVVLLYRCYPSTPQGVGPWLPAPSSAPQPVQAPAPRALFCEGCGEPVAADTPTDRRGHRHCAECDWPSVRSAVEWHAFWSGVPRRTPASALHEPTWLCLTWDPHPHPHGEWFTHAIPTSAAVDPF